MHLTSTTKRTIIGCMADLDCCADARLEEHTTDLGHANSFDFLLCRCASCGAWWLSVFGESSGVSGYEPVSAQDAQAMLAAKRGPELKALMKAWSEDHL